MSGTEDCQILREYIDRSVGPGILAMRVLAVMERLPESVVADFLNDSAFRLALDDLVEGQGRTVWMACPRAGNGSRCVVLKPRLADCPEEYAFYIIAHELAHAHLRNGGWEDIEDAELAADGLASHWGFNRPPRVMA